MEEDEEGEFVSVNPECVVMGDSSDVCSVAFSADGTRLVTGHSHYDFLVKIWDVALGAKVSSFPPTT